MTNKQIFERVLEDIKLRGLSPHTRKEYMDKTKVFIRYFDISVIELDEHVLLILFVYDFSDRLCGKTVFFGKLINTCFVEKFFSDFFIALFIKYSCP